MDVEARQIPLWNRVDGKSSELTVSVRISESDLDKAIEVAQADCHAHDALRPTEEAYLVRLRRAARTVVKKLQVQQRLLHHVGETTSVEGIGLA